MRRGLLVSTTLCLTVALVGCTSDSHGPTTSELTVYAAASLTDAFTDLADQFAAAHPEIDVRPVSFDGSSTLATQIAEGAPADVFASADERTMESLGDDVVDSQPFATNVLALAVPVGNPAGVGSLTDLSRPDLDVVLCASEVPCGRVSERLLSSHSVSVTAASREQNVKAVLTKVEMGQADAGLVYATDIDAADGRVDEVPIDADRFATQYPIARVAASEHPDSADEFIRFVLSPTGRDVLAAEGFGAP